MSEIWTMGEMLVEIMRSERDRPFDVTAGFTGPYPSGAPAIFIDAAARLGIKSGIIGGVGDDGFGVNLMTRLKDDGVDVSCVETLEGSTAVAFITYFSDHSREYIFHIKDTPAVNVKRPLKIENGNDGFFHLMGCSLFMDDGFRDEILKVMNDFIEKGFRISFDPNIRVELLKDNSMMKVIGPVMENCSVLLPGVSELLSITGSGSVDEAVSSLFDKSKTLEAIALKRGADGCTIYSRDGHFEVPAVTVDEVDPTGAGDCFDAGFLSGLLKGYSLERSANIAAAAGALNAAAFGPMEGKVTMEKIDSILSK